LAIWDHLGSQKGLIGVGKGIGDVIPTRGGASRHFGAFPYFCIIITRNVFNLEDSK
jgi:hypothetical protein